MRLFFTADTAISAGDFLCFENACYLYLKLISPSGGVNFIVHIKTSYISQYKYRLPQLFIKKGKINEHYTINRKET